MMKKIFAGFVAVLMSVFATGCRNHSEESGSDTDNQGTAVTTDTEGNKNADQKDGGASGNKSVDKAKVTEAAEAVTKEEVTYVYDKAGNIDIDELPEPAAVTEAPADADIDADAKAEDKAEEDQNGNKEQEFTEDGDIIV